MTIPALRFCHRSYLNLVVNTSFMSNLPCWNVDPEGDKKYTLRTKVNARESMSRGLRLDSNLNLNRPISLLCLKFSFNYFFKEMKKRK